MPVGVNRLIGNRLIDNSIFVSGGEFVVDELKIHEIWDLSRRLRPSKKGMGDDPRAVLAVEIAI